MKQKDLLRLRLGKVRRLTAGLTDHEHPVLSPDGSLLAYYAGEYGSLAIIVTDRRGRFARRLSPHGGNNTQPSWHPSSLAIAFRHQHNNESKWELWSASLATGELPLPLLADDRWHYKHPSYNPHGTSLLYFSDEGSSSIYHLWQLDLQTRERRQLTWGYEQNHCHPVFSPDGRRIVFHAYQGIDESRLPPITNIYELDLASGETRALTSGTDQYKHPFYLENNVIIYHHELNENGIRRIEAMHLDNGQAVLLTAGANNDKHPFPYKDPKGRRWLAFASKKRGKERNSEAHTYDIFLGRLVVRRKAKPRKLEQAQCKRCPYPLLATGLITTWQEAAQHKRKGKNSACSSCPARFVLD